MIDNFKPLGAFVENTIRPLLNESQGLIKELKDAGIELNENNIRRLIVVIASLHLRGLFFQLLTTIVTTIGVVIAACLIIHK